MTAGLHHDSCIFVAGHRGLVGSAVVRRLARGGYRNVLTRPRAALDLLDGAAVDAFFAAEHPEVVVLAAAKVGGILANASRPVDFLRENLLIQLHVVDAAARHGVRQLLFLGSSCIYPKLAPQPLREEYLLSGPLESTNEPYAVAKIAGIKLCEAYNQQCGTRFLSVMPTNLYGPGDNFDFGTSHVLPALVRKFHEARLTGAPSVEVWGTGTVRREFLHVDDMADACVFLLERAAAGADLPSLVNVGCGQDVTIAELAAEVAAVVGYEGAVVYDRSKPDGTPRKLLDVSRLAALGWQPRITLGEGLRTTYAWYLAHAGHDARGTGPADEPPAPPSAWNAGAERCAPYAGITQR